MDILYQRGKASRPTCGRRMPDAPGYSAVRAMLRVLEEKGHVRHQAEGLKYVYTADGGAREGQKLGGEAPAGHLSSADAPAQIVAALLDVLAGV